MPFPTPDEVKAIIEDLSQRPGVVPDTAIAVLTAYAKGVLISAASVEPLLEASEEAQDVLRDQFQPGDEEWNLSWGLQGARDIARGRDPLTGAPIPPEVTAERIAEGLTVFRINYKQPMELDAPCCEECDGIHPHG